MAYIYLAIQILNLICSQYFVNAIEVFIIANVDNYPITNIDLKNRLIIANRLEKMEDKSKKKITNIMIEENLLTQIAELNGVFISDDLLNQQINYILSTYKVKDLYNFCSSIDIDKDYFIKYLYTQVLRHKFIEQFIKPTIHITEYDAIVNIKALIKSKQVSLIKEEDNEVELEHLTLYKNNIITKSLENKLKTIADYSSRNNSLKQIVLELSDIKSSISYGYLGKFKKKQLCSLVKEQIDDMLIGNISKPIHYSDRVILIKLLARNNNINNKLSIKEAKEILMRRNLNLYLKEYINFYKNEFFIKIIKTNFR